VKNGVHARGPHAQLPAVIPVCGNDTGFASKFVRRVQNRPILKIILDFWGGNNFGVFFSAQGEGAVRLRVLIALSGSNPILNTNFKYDCVFWHRYVQYICNSRVVHSKGSYCIPRRA
jgi:hypothetical protein